MNGKRRIPKKRIGWERIRGGVAGIWRHFSGWEVRRCGHPTALWPYYGLPLGGGKMVLSPNGRAFQFLEDAQIAVEDLIHKERQAGNLARAQ